jgi:hypothetical protein
MNGMIVDFSKIPPNLPQVLEEFNSMKYELSKLKGENLKLLCYKKRCEIADYYGVRQFEYSQRIGFDQATITNRNKLLEAEVQNLKSEKGFYVKTVTELREKFEVAEAGRKHVELVNKNLRSLMDEKQLENQRFVRFIQGKQISDQFEEFLDDEKNPIEITVEIPRPVVPTIRRRNTRTMRRLSLEQTMETIHECFEENEEEIEE